MKLYPLFTLALVLAVSACDDEDSIVAPSADTELAQVWRDTERFHDISAAMAAGYTVWSPDPNVANSTCPSSAEGRMGYHLVNTALRGSPADPANADAVIDHMRPEMLLYEKLPDGSIELVGVEYIVMKAAWERVHGAGAAPPKVLGQTVPLSKHPFPPTVTTDVEHYELHVWLWEPNPHGMFHPWNPNVSC